VQIEPTPKARVLFELMMREGKARGITARDLAAIAGIPPRQVRSIVSALRLEGIAICGHPKRGYFVAVTPEELQETCAFLRARAMHSLVLESRLRNLPLPELLGQLRLNT